MAPLPGVVGQGRRGLCANGTGAFFFGRPEVGGEDLSAAKEKKARIISQLEKAFADCSIAVLTDYRGLSNAQITALRRQVQAAGGSYRVVKNTLARFAAARLERPELAEAFVGPVAVAFGDGDAVAVARAVADFIRTAGTTAAITGGYLEGRLLTAAEVNALARLPSREVLIAQVLGGMKAPLTGLVGVLAGPLRGLAVVLQGRIKQLEGEQSG